MEDANKTIKENIKKKLERAKGTSVDELPKVLRVHWTSEKVSIGETLFTLVFNTNTIIPAEVGIPSYRVEAFTEGKERENQKRLLINLDFLEEKRDDALI